jgi:hypothetical protein
MRPISTEQRKGEPMTYKVAEIKVKSCAPYAKGWQVNAFIDGVESEATFYGVTKAYALRQAKAHIEEEGRLPHAPYKGGN